MGTTAAATNYERDGSEQDAERQVGDEERDGLVLSLMLCESSSYPWSLGELGRTIDGDRIGALDAVQRLEAAGLLHRMGEFVFPTLACRRAGELDFG